MCTRSRRGAGCAQYAPLLSQAAGASYMYLSRSVKPQEGFHRPGRRTCRTCRRVGAGRSDPGRSSQHVGARRPQAMPPHSARSVQCSAAPAEHGVAADAGDADVPEAYVALAHRIADAAAEVTRRYFRCALAGAKLRGQLCTRCLPTPSSTAALSAGSAAGPEGLGQSYSAHLHVCHGWGPGSVPRPLADQGLAPADPWATP